MAMEKHFIQEGVIRSEIESFLRNELSRAGYSGINIQKTPLATRVILYVEKPPLVIGKHGKRINTLTSVLKERYGVDNPTIDVQKIENPTLDPNIIARRIATALERGMNRRRVVYKALRAVMSSRARGIEIVLSGKIVGKGGRSRSEKYLQGYMKKAGDSAKLVSTGRTQAYMKAGIIGVTVKIVPPNAIFPDQIFIKERVEEPKAGVLEEKKKTEEEEKKATGAIEEVKPTKEKKSEGKPKKAAVAAEEAKPVAETVKEGPEPKKTKPKKEVKPKKEKKSADKPKKEAKPKKERKSK